MSDTVKPMALSQAIRLGAMLKPQGTGALLSTDGRTCAVGAALDAIGQLREGDECSESWIVADAHWPMLGRGVAIDPRGGGKRAFDLLIMDLNDRHGWTREQIADWVEQIELQHGSSVPILDTAMSEVRA